MIIMMKSNSNYTLVIYEYAYYMMKNKDWQKKDFVIIIILSVGEILYYSIFYFHCA